MRSLIVNQKSNFLSNLTQNFRIVRVRSLFPGISAGTKENKVALIEVWRVATETAALFLKCYRNEKQLKINFEK